METVSTKTRSKQSKNLHQVNNNAPRFNNYISEAERLESFEKWPIPEVITPLELVRAGFFYSGHEDLVQCFSCGGGLSHWQKCEDPCFEHAKYYPTCVFILTEKSKDFVEEVKTVVKNQYTSEKSRLSSFYGLWSSSGIKTPDELARAGFFCTGHSDEVQCFECGVTIMNWKVYDDVWFKHSQLSPECTFVFNVQGPEFLDNVSRIKMPIEEILFIKELANKEKNIDQTIQYKTVEKRIESFKNWPISHIKKPEELATIGFYYTGEEDYVRCFHCNGLHFAWKISEDPSEEHARWYPLCVFIRQIKGEEFIEGVRKKWRDAYKSEEARKRSYKNWPRFANKTPEDLSSAGFFCVDNEDQTQCFDCGFWHIDWEVYDDPWFVHARLNPFCEFVRKIKGETFVNQVKQTLFSAKKNSKKRTYSSNESVNSVNDDIIQELMKCSTVQTVVKLGFNESKIKLALRDHLKCHESFKNVKDLFDVIVNSQKEDSEVFACLQNLRNINVQYMEAEICEFCRRQGPTLMLVVPCAHLLSCCSCVAKNLKHCSACNEEIEHKLEMFQK